MNDKNPLGISVKEIVEKNVVTATKDTIIYDVVEEMAIRNIGAIVVVEDGSPVGIVTERDILKRVLLGGLQVKHEKIKSIYTPNLISVSSENTVQEVCKKMYDGNFRHLPVVEDGKLVGIVSTKDLVKAFATV